MNTSDFDCPQYVCFETLQREMRDSSTLSMDSLDEVNHHQNDSLLSGDLSHSISDTLLSNYTESSNSMDIGDSNSLLHDIGSNEKENFHVNQSKKVIIKTKSKAPKTTQPRPFQFETDNRIKSKPTNTGSNYDEKDFASKLRQNTNTSSQSTVSTMKNRVTKVKPFNLTVPSKRKLEEDTEYIPLAEQISAFHQKVPERYQTTSQKEFQPQEHWEPPPLQARSPKLQAVKRQRVVTAISREEQELKEIKEYEFHARPVDPKIYKGPSKVKVQPKTKLATKGKNIRLRTAQRAALQRRMSSEKKYEFKARPVPKDILNGPTGLKEKPVIPITEAKAPAFQTDNRLQKRKIMEQEKKAQEEEKELLQKKNLSKHQTSVVKAPPAPYIPKRTEVQPFSFDKADRERFSRKEKKIQEELEEQSKPFVFRAQMMPVPEPSALPAVPRRPPTQPEPFKFELEHRCAKHDSLHIEEQQMSFKAQPADVLKKKPFVPEKPPKPNLEIEEFHLHTEKRASERHRLEEIKKAEEREKERILQEQKRIQEEQERMELMKLRQELVHKANPIPEYKPVEIKPSDKPLTIPISPEFETDKRLKTKH
ncbi:Targeting protein for Xklp2 like protein [Argiope bruennichi]|uniref:Targeting protein for Xklp2 like protein n=1 Tax=Argiope bruennichi TaxID=94029 RepID=A0A8T0FVK7_ARGBR|nr:Targeting protein for Xklp2 like protein [Argiope bruennichi]